MNLILARYNPWWDGEFSFDALIERKEHMQKMMESMEDKRITLITGLRRVGKTSILKLLIKNLLHKGIIPHHIFYVSLDDYNLLDKSIVEIIEAYRKLLKIPVEQKVFVFLDEITYKKDFELQLKNFVDHSNMKVFASASNSIVLEDKKAFLTGRTILYEVSPLFFSEYLRFKNLHASASNAHLLESYFEDYLKTGGIPEYVLSKKNEYLKNLVDDIIYKDIAAIHNVRDIHLLKDFFLLLMERSGKQLSINKIASVLSITPDTAKRYLEYFARTYLISMLVRYGKTNERIRAPKKIYAVDNGIRNHFTGFRDKGSLFENYVYQRIKHLEPAYYYQKSIEIDFFTRNKWLIEAKYHQEPLADKQQALFESISANQKFVVRSEEDINEVLSLYPQ